MICDCDGTRKLVRGTKLRDGSTVSCGCERADPEVRSAARRGPEYEHKDDALEALRPWVEPPPDLDFKPQVRIGPEPKSVDQAVRIAPEPKGVDQPVLIAPEPKGVDELLDIE